MTRAKDIANIISDANFGGTLDVTGETTLATHLNMGDGDKIKLGASADLQIYHDGTHSFISDEGTGNLIIKGSNELLLATTAGQDILKGTTGGDVKIYHNNAEKLATASTGVTVTGNVVINGGVVKGERGTASAPPFTFSDDLDTGMFNISNAHLGFAVGGSERARIHSNGVVSASAGVALGVGTANTASNVLDDYEEGTWTPTLSGATSGTRVISSGFKAVYTKVGNLVTAHMVAGIGGLTGSASGGARLGGLPFNYNGSNNEIMGKVHVTEVNLPAGIIDCTLLSATSGTSNVCFFVNMFDDANHGELGLSAFDENSSLRIVVTYHAV